MRNYATLFFAKQSSGETYKEMSKDTAAEHDCFIGEKEA